jgi:hypothetical protein
MLLRTREHPFAEARECARNRSDSDVSQNFPPFYALSAQSFMTLKPGFLKAVS